MDKTIKLFKKTILPHMILIFFALIFIMPLAWQVSTSLKSGADVFKIPQQWIPNPIRWYNYVDAVKRMPFLTYMRNSLVIAAVPIIGQVISSSMVSYSITKVEWKGKKIIFPIVLATIMLPMQVTMIPVYAIWAKASLINTFAPFIIPSLFGAAYNIFLLRQFYMTIPDSYVESARMDGAGELRILFQIIMPLSKPIITTIALFTFINGWNDFQGPLIYMTTGDMFPLSIGLNAFLYEHHAEWELLMAASTLFMLPMIVLFFIGQKQFIKGIVMTGFK